METEIMSISKILIVDDQPANLSILFDCLDSLNATVYLLRQVRELLSLPGEKNLILLYWIL
jgi:CheY-like chemotaxis protein